jgi:hypothetical protein
LRRCIDNPELIQVALDVEDSYVGVLWSTILWLKYKELIPEVRERLEKVTIEAVQSRRTDVEMHLSVMDSQLESAEEELDEYHVWAAGKVTVGLRTKIDNIKQARASLVALKDA